MIHTRTMSSFTKSAGKRLEHIMWSYSFEVPILMILVIILGFYFARPKLPIRRNLTFIHLIVAETVAIIANLAATMVDNEPSAYGTGLIKTLNMLYFLLFFERAYIMYLFSASVTKNPLQKNILIRQIIRLPLYFGVIVSVLSAVIGSEKIPYLIFYIDKNGYHSGNMYNYIYFCGFFYVLLSFVISFLYRKSLGRRREKYGIAAYNCLIFLSLFIRITLPKYLIMDTILLMAILVVFLAFINPEYFVELRGHTFNRVALSEHLEENYEHLNRVPLGVVVRKYHEMYDIYGATHMEEGLVLMGKFFRQLIPGGIVFYCRNGRFIILTEPDSDIKRIMDEIRERFNKPWKSQSTELYLSVSFVNYERIESETSVETIIKTTMKTLDIAGASESKEPLLVTEANLEQEKLEAKVRKCIETVIKDTGFELFLQPIVYAATGKVVGAEALSRIRDEEGNIIAPGIFIPVAENSGRINELGELVFDEACRFIKENDPGKWGVNWINVNLSPTQFIRTDLAERYASIVDKYGIDPGSVHLEITEGSMIDDSFSQWQIDAMTKKGFKFVLDDYGTGYSNLSRLKKCPFTTIKLDMSIVWDYCKEPDEILPNMIQAFKHMGFSVTAEGIEDTNMVNTMKNIGCDLLQGYYYSKPMPAAEFAKEYLK